MNILIWILIAYGMSNILVYGSIFQSPRDYVKHLGYNTNSIFSAFFRFLSDLTSCMMCCSTWVGFFLSLTFYSPSHSLIGTNQWYSIFLDGMLASGAVWGINSIIEWFEENRPNNNN
jgi:hypothetical protein